MEPALEQLMHDLKAVVLDVEALLGATAGATGERLAEARARAGESLAKARERVSSLEHEMRTRAQAAAEDVEGFVQDHPWQSMTAAAVLGLTLGLLLGRRRA
jgi:ElaB/YqjD/DUF883 family membrane-anchored ribosome-binding protein